MRRLLVWAALAALLLASTASARYVFRPFTPPASFETCGPGQCSEAVESLPFR